MATAKLKKTDASKENAAKALAIVTQHFANPNVVSDEDKKFALAFIESALKRLPKQTSINRDRKRKRVYTKPEPVTP